MTSRVARTTIGLACAVLIGLLIGIGSTNGSSHPEVKSPAVEESTTSTESSNAHVRAVVLFVGDSNVTLGMQSIGWALTWQRHNDNAYVPVMAPRVGASIRTYDCADPERCPTADYWKVRLRELLQSISPDVVVNNLGVNDTDSVGTETTPGSAAYDAKIDWFMDLLPGDVPVLWTNLPCAIEPPNRAPECTKVNQALSRASERWTNLVLVDWSKEASGHPEYMLSPGVDVHLSVAGREAWTALVLSELDHRF